MLLINGIMIIGISLIIQQLVFILNTLILPFMIRQTNKYSVTCGTS